MNLARSRMLRISPGCQVNITSFMFRRIEHTLFKCNLSTPELRVLKVVWRVRCFWFIWVHWVCFSQTHRTNWVVWYEYWA